MKIRVLGAAREVGGSCIAVEADGCKIALDYGIKLEGITDEYPKNFNAIVVTHAHLDHSGSLLRLVKSRNKQVIVGSKITRDIANELLKDMIKVQNLKGNTETYEEQAAEKVKASWMPTESTELPGMKVQLLSAGHVAGARMASIRAEGKSLLYTGDFCLHDTEILDGSNVNVLPKEPDLLISESTYGGRIRQPRGKLVDQLFKEIRGTLKHRGNVLIPTFAFHRSQEMAKRIDQAMQDGTLPHYHVYMVSKLAHRITSHFNANKELFKQEIQEQTQPFEYKYVQQVERTTEIEEPAIVVCTPGFGHAGASLTLLNEWAEVEENMIIVTSGYLPSDSPLKVARDKRFIRVDGEKYPVQAKILQIELSGHADQSELVELVTRLKPKRTVLVHGDLEQAEALSKQISDLTEVYIPEKNENIAV